MKHLASRLPYESTDIEPEYTKADIDAMLHEFIVLDERKQRSTEVTGIRWTDLPPSLPLLEFMVRYVDPQGVKHEQAFRLQPPSLMKKVRKTDSFGHYVHVNEPAKAQSMRLLYWYLKSKLEAVLFGLTDISHEFLSEALFRLPNGQATTVGDYIVPKLSDNKIPSLPESVDIKTMEAAQA
jgi:hypothetical protein